MCKEAGQVCDGECTGLQFHAQVAQVGHCSYCVLDVGAAVVVCVFGFRSDVEPVVSGGKIKAAREQGSKGDQISSAPLLSC